MGLKLTRTSDPNLPMTFHFLFQSLAAEQQKLFFFVFVFFSALGFVVRVSTSAMIWFFLLVPLVCFS